MIKKQKLITSVIRRVALQARGPALPLAKGLLEQIPQFISAGMPVEKALREALLVAIHAAQIRAKHCVGTERYALDDFIATCLKMDLFTEHLNRL